MRFAPACPQHCGCDDEPGEMMVWNPEGEFVLHESYAELQAEVERLRAERRWIPVSERLPTGDDGDEEGDVWVTDGKRVWSEYWTHVRKRAVPVKFWMPILLPMPDPPEDA